MHERTQRSCHSVRVSCANDACGGSLSSCVQSSQSLSSPILLLAPRASFAAASLGLAARLHALHPQNALLVVGPLIPRFSPPSRMRLWCAPCGTPEKVGESSAEQPCLFFLDRLSCERVRCVLVSYTLPFLQLAPVVYLC